MFFTFLNKENAESVDLTIMRKYAPEKVLFYYYNSSLTLTLDTCLELLTTIETNKVGKILMRWYQLLDDLQVPADLSYFQENKYLNTLGPYYYPDTNSRFYITKNHISPNSFLSVEDMEILNSLQATPEVNKELQAYYKNRRNVKKASKNKDDMLKDIGMCIKALNETESLNQHINFINKLLESRYALVEKADLEPMEPDNIPVKPSANNESRDIKDSNIIPFKLKKKNEKSENLSFNYETKVYFIRYREYEKACERFKLILSEWPNHYLAFMDDCYKDIAKAEDNLKKANSALDVFNTILLKSYIHPDYQEISILNMFIYYLETGRANDLQECMNLFEEEKYWKDIKASQNRIENTIYYLQSETDLTRFADENINSYLRKFNEVTSQVEKVND